VIHNILNEYKADKGYYTIMPIYLSRETINIYNIKGENEKLKKEIKMIKEENEELKDKMERLEGDLKEESTHYCCEKCDGCKKCGECDCDEEEKEELRKKIRKLKYDIYEIIGHENYETGYGGADLVKPEYMRDHGWDFPTQN